MKDFLPDVAEDVLKDYLEEAKGHTMKAINYYFYAKRKMEQTTFIKPKKSMTVNVTPSSSTIASSSTHRTPFSEFPSEDYNEAVDLTSSSGTKRRGMEQGSSNSKRSRVIEIEDDEPGNIDDEFRRWEKTTFPDLEPNATRSTERSANSYPRPHYEPSISATYGRNDKWKRAEKDISEASRREMRQMIRDLVGTDIPETKIDELLCIHNGDIEKTADACFKYVEMQDKIALQIQQSYSSSAYAVPYPNNRPYQAADRSVANDRMLELLRSKDFKKKLRLVWQYTI